jgi:hypothetical protein
VTFPDSASLGGARAWLREQASGDGASCPCCSQFTKVYRRTITSTLAANLLRVWRDVGTGEPFHMPSKLAAYGGDMAKLRYWLLITDTDSDQVDVTGRAGWWKITEAGEAFARGEIKVPKHALVFDGKCLGLDSSRGEVDIYAALGEHFSYEVLMSARAGVEPAI